jgi:solute carrier family 10 (sodium/bile acid cotransporter), member 7
VFPKFTKRYIVDLKITKLSPLCLLVVVWQIYDQAFSSRAFETVKADNIIFIVFISIALFMVLNGIAFLTSIVWLKREDVVSVCYCVPAKSPAMGVPLAMTMFVGLEPALQAKLQLPMAIYQALQIVGGTILVPVFKRWVENGKKRLEEQEKVEV